MKALKRVWVVVLGDFGRSPRMQYHALSLATQVHFAVSSDALNLYSLSTFIFSDMVIFLQAGLSVDVLAYGGSEPLAAILENRSITLYAVPDPCATDTAAQPLASVLCIGRTK